MFKTQNSKLTTHNAKGFTLIEVIVVMIIIGVLATFAMPAYTRMIEKSRGSEGMQGIASIKKMATASWQSTGVMPTAPNLTDQTGYPITAGNTNACIDITTASTTVLAGNHFFTYSITGSPAATVIRANRCATGGKNPIAATTNFVQVAGSLDGTAVDAFTMSNIYQ